MLSVISIFIVIAIDIGVWEYRRSSLMLISYLFYIAYTSISLGVLVVHAFLGHISD